MKISCSALLASLLLARSDGFTVTSAPVARTAALKMSSQGGPPMNTSSLPVGAGGPMSPSGPQTQARGPAPAPSRSASGGAIQGLKDAHKWESDEQSPIVTVQGESLKTWSFTTESVERVQVLMKTEGRPLNANVELWQSPSNTPQKMQVYIEDGCLRPFSAVIETPRGASAVAIYNTGHLEFPLEAKVHAELEGRKTGMGDATRKLSETGTKKVMQGGSIHTVPFPHNVASVQVMLKTDGRPLHARIELMQGPNNNKQVMDIYTEDGLTRPFFAILETPGSGNVVRIINTGTVEFPLTATAEAYQLEQGMDDSSSIFMVS